MKRLSFGFALLLFAAGIGWGGIAGRAGQQPPNNTPMSFAGEVMDNVCGAQASHDAMMKKEGYKNAKDCALGCVAAGGTFVLYATANRTVYLLDDQEKPRAFAGQKVTVIGTYDGETKTIHVQSIQAAP
jgi:Protein of unknown function (DUF5818)